MPSLCCCNSSRMYLSDSNYDCILCSWCSSFLVLTGLYILFPQILTSAFLFQLSITATHYIWKTCQTWSKVEPLEHRRRHSENAITWTLKLQSGSAWVTKCSSTMAMWLASRRMFQILFNSAFVIEITRNSFHPYQGFQLFMVAIDWLRQLTRIIAPIKSCRWNRWPIEIAKPICLKIDTFWAIRSWEEQESNKLLTAYLLPVLSDTRRIR